MILKHLTSLVRILSHPVCKIIRQLDLDLDLIKVSNGFFFNISTRSTKRPEAGYFSQGIRGNFCNKFYQCLMATKMLQTVWKLAVAAPKDSGKTCWAMVFHQITPPPKKNCLHNQGASVLSSHDGSRYAADVPRRVVPFNLESDVAKTKWVQKQNLSRTPGYSMTTMWKYLATSFQNET